MTASGPDDAGFWTADVERTSERPDGLVAWAQPIAVRDPDVAGPPATAVEVTVVPDGIAIDAPVRRNLSPQAGALHCEGRTPHR